MKKTKHEKKRLEKDALADGLKILNTDCRLELKIIMVQHNFMEEF